MSIPLKHIHKIRKALCMTDKQPFLRCQARSSEKAKALDEKLGRKHHMQAGHVCRECRCNRVAGEGTRGDFYGFGDDRVGHYGIGWCKWHEMGQWRKGRAEKFARSQMEVVQTIGRAATSNMGEFVDVVQSDAEVYSYVQQVRKASEIVLTHLEEFKDLCEKGELTMKAKNGDCVPADDVTRIKLANELAKTIGSVTKTEVDINSRRMVPVEDVVMRIKMMIDIVRRFMPDPKEQVKFFEEFKDIWKPVVERR